MSKKTLLLLISIMSSALIGILFLQILLLRNDIDGNEISFSNKVQLILQEVSIKIRENEEQTLFKELCSFNDKVGKYTDKQPSNLRKQKLVKKKHHIYGKKVLEDEVYINYEINDSISTSKKNSKYLSVYSGNQSFTDSLLPTSSMNYMLSNNNSQLINRYFNLKRNIIPVEDIISIDIIDSIFLFEFKKNKIKLNYEFAVLKNDLTPTHIVTEKFKNDNNTFYTSLFKGVNNESDYILSVSFPNKNSVINMRIIGQFILSALFVLMIMTVFGVSLYYIRKQRQIHEVKASFINNITHEFKTPIATINVAADALKSPIVLKNVEKIKHYADLIKLENKRLNSQIEMILRMSRLDKNEINLDIQKVNLNHIIKDAVSHIRLIVENRNGIIIEKYSREELFINVDLFHITNVFLNVLDNANKYSLEPPRISVEVFKNGEFACVQIQDKGIGMSKSVQKKIFDKFYREETGNIHNIKGYGLGLSYLKKIVDLHGGLIEVWSEKNKGSKFVIKIPL